MTTLAIALIWIVTIALMFGTLYVIGNVGFWIFVQIDMRNRQHRLYDIWVGLVFILFVVVCASSDSGIAKP